MRKLLIVKLSSIGDVLHALPVVKSIKDDLPELSIGWVVRDRCAGLLDGCTFLDRVHVVKKRMQIGDFSNLRHEMVQQEYDTAFDMQGLFLSGVITALSGARRRVGLNRNREMNRLFLTEPSVEGLTPGRHAVDVLLGFRATVGLSPTIEFEGLTHLGASSEAWWRGQDEPGTPKKTVVLNVGASSIYKRWPQERWVELGSTLIKAGCRVVLTAGPTESEDSRAIAECLNDRNVLDLGGRTSTDQLAAVLKDSDLVISGDTGPMHMAVAVGTPTIALFGPTDPGLTGPYGNNHQVIWKHLPCSPCFRHPTCEGRVDCLKAISAREVADAASANLSRLKEVVT